MMKEELFNLVVYVGSRLRMEREYFNNLMATLFEYTEPKEALIMFILHLKRYRKWLIGYSPTWLDEVVIKLIETYNKYFNNLSEIVAYLRKYLPWVYEAKPNQPYDNVSDFLLEE